MCYRAGWRKAARLHWSRQHDSRAFHYRCIGWRYSTIAHRLFTTDGNQCPRRHTMGIRLGFEYLYSTQSSSLPPSQPDCRYHTTVSTWWLGSKMEDRQKRLKRKTTSRGARAWCREVHSMQDTKPMDKRIHVGNVSKFVIIAEEPFRFNYVLLTLILWNISNGLSWAEEVYWKGGWLSYVSDIGVGGRGCCSNIFSSDFHLFASSRTSDIMLSWSNKTSNQHHEEKISPAC